MKLTRAGPAEILRAAQKDEHYITKYQSLVSDAVLQLKGTRFSIENKSLIDTLSKFVYYASTTLSGFQTLGEEYTGILQTDPNLRKIPSFKQRLLMVILDCCGLSLFNRLLMAAEKQIIKNPDILPSAKSNLLKGLKVLKSTIPFIDRMHKAFFYYTGGTYHLSKRVTGIHYVLSRFWLKDRNSLYGFRVLALVTGLQTLIAAVAAARSATEEADEFLPATVSYEGRGKCSLCLEPPQQPTATPCGHVLCWRCLLEWLSRHGNCPVCRSPAHPSRAVPLLNYS